MAKIANTRANTIKERTRFCEKHACFEIVSFFPSPTRQGKKGGNFKTIMRFTETNPLLYCLSSSYYQILYILQ